MGSSRFILLSCLWAIALGQPGILLTYDPATPKSEVLASLDNQGFEIAYDYQALQGVMVVKKKGQAMQNADGRPGPPANAADIAKVKSTPKVKGAEADILRFRTRPATQTATPTGSTCASKDPNILGTTEYTPYGIRMVQGDDRTFQTTTAKNSVRNNVIYCITDGGVYSAHPDFIGNQMVGSSNGALAPWNIDYDGHGTHVSGTIGATAGQPCTGCNGGNINGIIGVVQTGATLFQANVFGERDGTTDSKILLGLDECMLWREKNKPNAKVVISMSLGGSKYGNTFDKVQNDLYATGSVLLFAAAGNEAQEGNPLNYPAGFSNVISIASVDSSGAKAPESNYNPDVELSAPGVSTMSTVPTIAGDARLDYVDSALQILSGPTLDAVPASVPFPGGVTGSATGYLVDCGYGNNTACPNASGKICFISRGSNYFCEKANNCAAGGGIGAIIYNNPENSATGCEALGGTLDTPKCATPTIPVVGISNINGLKILSYGPSNVRATIKGVPDPTLFSFFSGTSMACPHAAGVAGMIWSQYPNCPNAKVRQALRESAKVLGGTAPNDNFGYGLVQAKTALAKLSKLC